MSEAKAHHFVPQLLLRRFGSDVHRAVADRRQINTYLIDRGRFIRAASIRDQAQQHKLYGPRESSFCTLETVAGDSIARVLRDETTPLNTSQDFANLISFVWVQACRTPRAAEEHVDFVNELFRGIVRDHPDPDFPAQEILDSVRIKIKNPLDEAIALRIAMLESIIDLHCGVLVNNTEHPFILSDHPVVFYNQFFERRGVTSGGGGLKVKGLQIFMPIDPHHYLIFYDSEVYDFGNTPRFNGISTKANPVDVRKLNELQVLAAQRQLFCDASVSESYVHELVTSCTTARSERRPLNRTVNAPGQKHNPDGTLSTYMVTVADTYQTGMKLSVIRELPSAQRYVIHLNRMHLRKLHHFLWKVQTGRSSRWSDPAFKRAVLAANRPPDRP